MALRTKLRQYVRPPVFTNNEEKTRAAAVLNAMQLALLAVILVGSIGIPFIFTKVGESLLVVAAIFGACVISRVLMYKGYVRLATHIVVWSIWIFVTALMIFAGGIKGIDATYYITLTVISGLLLGTRMAAMVAILSSLSSFAIAISESLGYSLPQFFPILPMTNWFKFFFGLVMVVVPLNMALKGLKDALKLAQQEIEERKRVEAIVRHQEHQLRTITDNIPAGVAYVGIDDLEYRFVNRNFEIGYNLPRSEIIGKHMREIIGEANYKIATPHIEQVRNGKRASYENTYNTNVGQVWVHVNYVPDFDDQGRVQAIIILGHNITDRKRVEEIFRHQERQLRIITDNIPAYVAYVGIDDLRYRFVNRNFEIAYNRPREEIIGKHIREIIGESNYEFALPYIEKVRNGEETSYENSFDTNAGRLWANVNYVPDFDDQGRVQAIIVLTHDITARKRAENERERLLVRIQEQVQQVQQIIDTVPEGVLLLDAEGCVTLTNPQGRRDLHILARASVGDVLHDLGGRALETLLQPPAGRLWHEVEAEERSYQVTARTIEPGQEARGWLLVIRDVTQQRDIERRAQQQERLAAVGQLAAGIAHDFNNIMATVVLYTQMSIRTAGVPATVRERLVIIHQQAMYATQLIQQILDFSRRAILTREPVNLLALLNDQVNLLRRTLPENITITLEHTADDFFISGSPASIQQVIMNLAVNARDAMPEGGALRFELAHVLVDETKQGPLPELTGGDWITLAITDTGAGIAPDVRPHIFNPFFTTKAPGEGTGLGLAQVDGIIGMHGGQIDLRTGVNQGTTFTLYLPTLPLPEAKAPTNKAEDGLVSGSGQTILVVEDNAVTRMALVDSLEACNYNVRVAENGRRALEILAQRPADIALVLSDIVMPEMGGLALVRAMAKQGFTVKVVLLTGHPLEAEQRQLQGTGAAALLADWILKPPDLEALSRMIAHALS